MSHYLAEMMDRVEHEENADRKEKYQQQTAELILKIWEHRSTLSGDAYPLARFKGIISSLSILSPEANVWEKNKLNRYERLAAESFSMVVNLFRTLHFIEFSALKSVNGKQVPPSALTNEEQEVYDFAISWAEEELNFRSSNFTSNKSEYEEASDHVCDYIDEVCKTLNELKKTISTIKKS